MVARKVRSETRRKCVVSLRCVKIILLSEPSQGLKIRGARSKAPCPPGWDSVKDIQVIFIGLTFRPKTGKSPTPQAPHSACDSPEYAAGFTEIFLNLCGTVEMFYAFFDRIRKK